MNTILVTSGELPGQAAPAQDVAILVGSGIVLIVAVILFIVWLRKIGQ
ncbi:MAG: hypothetical protein HY340_01775 [Candidatus Kerfeldbacteria bacterium]|nr:hypothetical protein [Candidatus Kerfeldbacteria bacterium]